MRRHRILATAVLLSGLLLAGPAGLATAAEQPTPDPSSPAAGPEAAGEDPTDPTPPPPVDDQGGDQDGGQGGGQGGDQGGDQDDTGSGTDPGTGTDPDDGTGPDDPTDPGTEPEDPLAPFTVEDAVFRWGVNDESNNKGFAPGTFNFLSAGIAPDPGSGGQLLDNQGRWVTTGAVAWRRSVGATRIEKVTPSGPVPATYAGLRTGPSGEEIPTQTSGIFSNHQVVIEGGRGTVDPRKRTATISWRGSFTVFFYSGLTFFSVSDPTLEVTADGAKVTATASGFRSAQDDASVWGPLRPTRVTLADLQPVTRAQLSAVRGFSAPTRYRGVRYPEGTQLTTEDHWGAAPRSLLRFLEPTGTAPYWYSSGGSTDRYKPTHPIHVSWDARNPLSTDQPSVTPVPEQPRNEAGAPPPPLGVPLQPPAPLLPSQLPLTPVTDPGAVPVAAGTQAPTWFHASAPRTAPPSAVPPATTHDAWEWFLGTLLLVGAAGLGMATSLLNRPKGTR